MGDCVGEKWMPDFDVVDEFRRENPQLTLIELAAWLDAVRIDGSVRQLGGLGLVKGRAYTTSFVKSISSAEERFSIPARDYIKARLSDQGWFARVTRYFGYVWIDATATSAVAGFLYAASLRQSGLQLSRFNSLYPWLVTALGTPLKLLLVAAAIPSFVILMATLIVFTVVNLLAYISGNGRPLEQTLGALGAMSGSVLGIIATVAISNINPIFLLKTVFVDPLLCVRVINEINLDIEDAALFKASSSPPTVASTPFGPTPSATPAPIQGDLAYKIIATFTTTAGIRNDAVLKAAENFGYGYVFKRTLSEWSPRNFSSKGIEFTIQSDGVKDILATAQFKKINDHNILSLQFTKEATVDDKHRIPAGFRKMVENIEPDPDFRKIEDINCDIAASVLIEPPADSEPIKEKDQKPQPSQRDLDIV